MEKKRLKVRIYDDTDLEGKHLKTILIKKIDIIHFPFFVNAIVNQLEFSCEKLSGEFEMLLTKGQDKIMEMCEIKKEGGEKIGEWKEGRKKFI